MLTPKFQLPVHSELVIDLFAGGGGTTTGIKQAIIAANYSEQQIMRKIA